MQQDKSPSNEWLTIGEVAAMVGLQTSTLLYYESIGLLPRAQRVSGKRRYTTAILPLLAVIQMAKEASFSLPEIQALLHARNEGEALSQRWQTLAAAKISELDGIINRAQEMKALLEEALNSDALQFELDQVEAGK
ncbi:MAG: MerR family transcriptional regulator [Anaerolineae bacterium]|nr:MerR family transcriptional regulator [Anaerolineae bacterium]